MASLNKSKDLAIRSHIPIGQQLLGAARGLATFNQARTSILGRSSLVLQVSVPCLAQLQHLSVPWKHLSLQTLTRIPERPQMLSPSLQALTQRLGGSGSETVY